MVSRCIAGFMFVAIVIHLGVWNNLFTDPSPYRHHDSSMIKHDWGNVYFSIGLAGLISALIPVIIMVYIGIDYDVILIPTVSILLTQLILHCTILASFDYDVVTGTYHDRIRREDARVVCDIINYYEHILDKENVPYESYRYNKDRKKYEKTDNSC